MGSSSRRNSLSRPFPLLAGAGVPPCHPAPKCTRHPPAARTAARRLRERSSARSAGEPEPDSSVDSPDMQEAARRRPSSSALGQSGAALESRAGALSALVADGEARNASPEEQLRERAVLTERSERVLVTVLTKRMAQELTDYYVELGVRCRYLHSDIDTLERMEIIRQLRA